MDITNDLRTRQGTPVVLRNSDEGVILAEVLEERRRELYMEGHRINDMIRHDRPFPTHHPVKELTYGLTISLPLPDAERLNNPHIGS